MIISERSLEAADEKLKEIVLSQDEEIESDFVDHLIRKFVFGGKRDEPVAFDRFTQMMQKNDLHQKELYHFASKTLALCSVLGLGK